MLRVLADYGVLPPTHPATEMVWHSRSRGVAHKGDGAAGWLKHPLMQFANTSTFSSLALQLV